MSDHYYSKTPNAESSPKHWSFTLRNREFRFKTDNGVFSKKEVDFGSRLLIETFKPNSEVEGNLLDVGCGYGPIGLSLASERKDILVHMVDVNARAIELAKENAQINHIENVKIYESDKLTGVEESGFASVLTNPPIRAGKQVVHEIFEQSFAKLADGGELWVVIQKKQGAPSAMEKMEELFGDVELIERKKGYYILCSKKKL
ncbi:16S rRNA (guanine1207-N2)-methyltransferase [Peribacillus deserti]|uniref:16S rRNA (Guanine1207-N2)-methyltransferase n=1 Tax=Peribacillus deserti TaxID=673318 RepID=A0ABS2QMF8_9BACI|nr:class I SAM-dependent methyltransferase [Peribacillus deserti]MBM7694348.1 16S rRNA (guanine1207-N2)-methyltransferase [Peribacillus deserti]